MVDEAWLIFMIEVRDCRWVSEVGEVVIVGVYWWWWWLARQG